MKNLDLSRDSVKTGMRFLIKNKLVAKIELKVGKNGWSKYSIDKNLYKNISKSIQKGSIDPFIYKGSISSSSLNIKTTTNLPQDWLDINFDPLSHIGFTKNHLEQLHKTEKYSPQDIQNSIYYFAFDLKHNGRAEKITRSSPIAYFISTLKNHGLIVAPKNYESPQDRAMREYLEREKEIQKKREEMEKELFETTFFEWKGQLNEDEVDQIIPTEIKHKKVSGPKVAALRQHFRENIWPKKRTLLIAEIEKTKED